MRARGALKGSRAMVRALAGRGISPTMREAAPLFSRGRTGLTVVGVALATFAVLYAIVRANRSAATDAAITLRLQRRHHPLFDRLMRMVSWPGFPPQSRLLPPAIAGSLVLLGYPLEGLFQIF